MKPYPQVIFFQGLGQGQQQPTGVGQVGGSSQIRAFTGTVTKLHENFGYIDSFRFSALSYRAGMGLGSASMKVGSGLKALVKPI